MKYLTKYHAFLLISAVMAPAFLPLSTAADPSPPTDSVQTSANKSGGQTPKKAENKQGSVSFGEYLAGRFAEQSGDTQTSIKYLRGSLARDPENKDILVNLYNALITAGDVEDAVPIAKKLGNVKLQEEGNEFPPQLVLTIDSCKRGDFASARKYLQEVPKAGFNSVLLPLLTAWVKLGNGEIKTPIEPKDIFPTGKMLLAHIYLNAAMINEIAGFSDIAAQQYEAAAGETSIESARAAEALANYYYRKGNKDKYNAYIKQYTQTHGESVIGSLPFGTTPIKPLVNNASEGSAEALYTVASIFHGVRMPADEITTLKIALYLRPDFPLANFLLAGAYELKREFPQAIANYKAIGTDSIYYTQARIMMAYDENEIGHREQAIEALDAISKENPHEISALLAKGDIYRTGNDFQHSIEAYDAALDRVKAPRKPHWIIYFSRGICYDRLGSFDKTETDLKRALALSPGEPDVLNYLGYSWLVKKRNLAEAKKMISEAYDTRPEDAEIIDSMGYALYIDGDFASAQEYFEQALERIPNDPTINDHLGDAYWQLGRKTEAGYQWQRALDNKPDEEEKKELLKKLATGIASIAPSGKKPSKSVVQ